MFVVMIFILLEFYGILLNGVLNGWEVFRVE